MNTILKRTINIALFFLLSVNFVNAEKTDEISGRKENCVVIDLKGSYSASFENFFETGALDGLSGSTRIMWHPNRRLRIGVESGFLNVIFKKMDSVETEFGNTNFSSRINAVPILLVFNMQVWEIDLYAGTGGVVLSSHVKSFGKSNHIIDYDYCLMFSTSYSYPLTKYMEIGVEASTYYYSQLKTFSGGLGLNLKFIPFKW